MAIIASVLVILVPLPAALMDVLLSANIAVAVLILLDDDLCADAARVQRVSDDAAGDDARAAGAERRHDAADLEQGGDRRRPGGRARDPGVCRLRGRRRANRRGHDHFRHYYCDPVRRDHQGCHANQRSGGAVSLDGMPGKQMAIDADLNAGIIDERQAQARRAEITSQADFYGAMDGASKFVRGDAIAGILIAVINVVGGLIIGVAQFGMSFGNAAHLYTRLTIGDGLVSQVPAFLISLAAGLLVTRSTQSINLPHEFLRQVFSRSQALTVTGGFLAILMFTSLPRIPLVVLGGACLGIANLLNRREAKTSEDEKHKADDERNAKPKEERVEDFLTVDPMELELGVGLIRLADPNRGGDLLDRVQRVRQNMAGDIGILLPKVRIRDNMRLDAQQYRIKIADMPVAQGEVEPGRMLAIDSGITTGQIDGIATKDPAFGTDAKWIDPAAASQAEMYGYTVVEPGAVLATHLTEVCRRHADEILNRDATKHLVDELKKTSPAVVDGLIPGTMSVADVQSILQMLLREQVSVRQLRAEFSRRSAIMRRGRRTRSCSRNTCGIDWHDRFAHATATRRESCTS